MRSFIKGISALASLLLLAPACSKIVSFDSPSPLGAGIAGKNWQAETFVDSSLFNSTYSTPILVADFSAASSESSLQLAANFYNPSTSLYQGYARLYQDGTGWSALGPQFTAIAQDTQSFSLSSILAAPGGIFWAVFMDPLPNAFIVENPTGTWNAAATSSIHPLNSPSFYQTADLESEPVFATAADSLGIGYAAYIDSTSHLDAGSWQAANPNFSSIMQLDSMLASHSGITLLFDGKSNICVTYETSTGSNTLNARCGSTTGSNPFPGSSTAFTYQDTGVMGHASAVAPELGAIMLVYYKVNGSTAELYGAMIDYNGVPLSNPSNISLIAQQIDQNMPTGFATENFNHNGNPNAPRPGIAYLGNGTFIAVWVGDNGSGYTALFYSLYTVSNSGWSTPAEISGTLQPYVSNEPAPRGLSVFANGNGNAGFAMTFAETSKIFETMVDRFQIDNLWLDPQYYADGIYGGSNGNGCNPQTTTYLASCTHPPVGVILTSGDTVVLFQDQDNLGNYRLAEGEFR